MADDSGGEKTEQPTEKKLRDAREKGQVAISQDVTATASITAAFASIYFLWDYIRHSLQELFSISIESITLPFLDGLNMMLYTAMEKMIMIILPILLSVMVAVMAAVFAQIGLLFSLESVTPSFDKINPKQYFKKVFSKKGLVDLVKTFVKVAVLGTLLYLVTVNNIPLLLEAPLLGREGVLYILGEMLFPLVLFTIGAFSVIAVLDFIVQKSMHTKELMMSLDEIKREFKESEGSPEIKGQRKQIHQEMAMSDATEKVKKSNVLITNPTHLAIALYYKQGKTDLPIVLSIGEDFVALRMKQIAEEYGVPIMQNVPLARGLFVEGKVNQYIPSEFIEPVAEVIRWVQDLDRAKHSY
ncbi:MAG: type III secretion system export apparatus subunit SctU [Desulfovibrionaceae bacterium]